MTGLGRVASSAPGIKREIFTTSGGHCRALRLAGSAGDAGAGRSKALAGARVLCATRRDAARENRDTPHAPRPPKNREDVTANFAISSQVKNMAGQVFGE